MHRLYLAFFVLILPFFLVSCTEPEPEDQPGPRPVRAMQVGKAQGEVVRRFSGTAQASHDIALSFRVSGMLQYLPVEVGQRVKAGVLIARLDSRDFEIKVKELEAQAAQARAAFNKARADYERVRGLYEVGNVSRSDLDQAQAGYETAAAQLEAVEQNLDLVRQQVTYTRLYAPHSGSISAVPVENFQMVQTGQPVAILSTDEELEFQVGVPDHLIHQINTGDTAFVHFDILPDQRFEAQVHKVGIQPGKMSTYPVTLRLSADSEQARQRIRPGMAGEAEFTMSSPETAGYHVVPSQAVFGLPTGEQAVWLVDRETETVHRREVQVGRLVPDGIQVLEGLSSGDLLVIRGVHRLEQNQKVRLNGQPGQTRPQNDQAVNGTGQAVNGTKQAVTGTNQAVTGAKESQDASKPDQTGHMPDNGPDSSSPRQPGNGSS